jgi:hypothetical protein
MKVGIKSAAEILEATKDLVQHAVLGWFGVLLTPCPREKSNEKKLRRGLHAKRAAGLPRYHRAGRGTVGASGISARPSFTRRIASSQGARLNRPDNWRSTSSTITRIARNG